MANARNHEELNRIAAIAGQVGLLSKNGMVMHPGNILIVGCCRSKETLPSYRKKRPLILPAVFFCMAIGKNDDGTFIVPAGGNVLEPKITIL